MDFSVIRVVLVDPRIPENIGMAARAMKNCGLSRLALVRGVDPRQPAACRPAMDALSILEAAETFEDLDSAVARSRMVVGTTRREGQDRQPLLSPAEWIRDVLPRAAGEEISILFGTEKDGLTREAVARCDVLITLGGHPDFPSFNLAQAVLLVAYELFRTVPKPPGDRKLDLATAAEGEAFFRHLEAVMVRIGFLHENHPGRILSTFRRLLGRTGLEEREIRILRGFLSQIEWALGAGNKAGSEGAGAGSPGGGPEEP